MKFDTMKSGREIFFDETKKKKHEIIFIKFNM